MAWGTFCHLCFLSGITSVLCWLKGFEEQIDTVEIQSSQMNMPTREVMNSVLQG